MKLQAFPGLLSPTVTAQRLFPVSVSYSHHSATFKPQGQPSKQGPAQLLPICPGSRSTPVTDPNQAQPASLQDLLTLWALSPLPLSAFSIPHLFLLFAVFASLVCLFFSLFSLHADLDSDLSLNPACPTYYLVTLSNVIHLESPGVDHASSQRESL